MNHKKLIFGVVIIHVCFMLIGASGIISTLKEKEYFLWSADKYDLSVDFNYHDWSGNEAIFDHFILKKFKADRISVNIKKSFGRCGNCILVKLLSLELLKG